MKQLSHSELRHRILSSLNLEPASSVTSLAERLEILRPSVSRAVSALQEASLITRQERTISLNVTGQEELFRLNAQLSAKVKKTTDLATRLMEQVTETGTHMDVLKNSSILRLAETFANSPFLQLSEAIASSPVIQFATELASSPVFQIATELASSPAFQVATELANNASFKAIEAFTATANIQAVNLSLLQTWKQEIISPLNHLVLENNVLLSNMMVDLEAFTKIGTTVSQTLGRLIDQTTLTTKIYDAYFIDIVSDLKYVPTYEALEISLNIPTAAAASLVGSSRRIVESEIVSSLEEVPANGYAVRTYTYSERYVVLTPKLEAYLKPLGQRFIDKWEGAWQTLYSGNKDRHSQATHSGRELLMQVLAYLAPDSVFTKEDCTRHKVEKPSRKMRIKYILGNNHKSSVELIDSMADTLDRMYDVLVAEAHRRDDYNHLEDTIVGQLAALGASLIMLLSLYSSI